ncbi:MAG: hypothetical protein B6A08_01440 [Sorangiineae bacterium NIC37A_2]|jgi:serine/threonine protein kinase|nr:MAG: hypothetical protein B6A08_01440 [Sorangiineae bacterium NIC37A_2]
MGLKWRKGRADESPQSALRRLTPALVSASPELLATSRDRLGWIAFAVFALTCAQRLINTIHPDPLARPLVFEPWGITLAETGVLLDMSMFLVVRLKNFSDTQVLRFGLAYQLFRAFTLSLSPSPSPDPPLLSWAAFASIIVPLTLPPHGVLGRVMPILAALTQPLGMFGLSLTREIHPEYIFRSTMVALFAGTAGYWCSELIRRIRADEPRHAGSYNLVRKIGEGGMGEVWMAEHRYLLRPAALKLIPAARHESRKKRAEALRRFRREAQVTALLTSPHTVRVFDYGITDTGLYYYVMEHLVGIDLQRLVQIYGPLSPGRACYLIRQVADSLGEAHQAGLIHRDVKPGNIMIVRAGQQYDFVKVLDFGLVGIGQATGELSTITREGMMTGTPAFISPEMVRGDAVDGRADIYSLGCVLFFLVTGRLVFPGMPPTAMALAHAHEKPPSPKEVAKQPIPDDLEELILLCLEKYPDARPATARELAIRLGALGCAHDWTAYDAENWWMREMEPSSLSQMSKLLRASDSPSSGGSS